MFGSEDFIPSVTSGFEQAEKERVKFRRKRRQAALVSFFLHVSLVVLMVSILLKPREQTNDRVIVLISNGPMYLPPGDSEKGGGGGGGGKKEKLPPEKGRLPEVVQTKLVIPDPKEPQPLIPPENKEDPSQKIIAPVEIPQDEALPIGDIQAPPGEQKSAGSGSGGGIGTGPGSGSGSGSGPGEGVGDGTGPYSAGSGVVLPIPILQPKPPYTEDARKQNIQGNLLLQVIIRKNGRVEDIKIIKSLGHGLDESAIETIANKWLFKPATLKGRPVDVQVQIEVTFNLL